MAQDALKNIPAMFLERVVSSPNREAFRAPSPGGWSSFTWREVAERVRAISAGLRALGVSGGERCAILSSTRLEWILADLGILCAGGSVTTIYPSSTADDCAFILFDSGARAAFAEDVSQLAKLESKRSELPALEHVIVLEGEPRDSSGFALSLSELEALGRGRPDALEQVASETPSDALATLIYTSGTTGRPKGVELTHDCWLYEAEAIDALQILNLDDLQLLWLPLAHSFGKVLEVAQLRIGFASAVDGRIEKLVDNLGEVKPTFFCGVPRIFEKVHNRLITSAAESPVKQRVFSWALSVGERASKLEQAGQKPSALLAVQRQLAERLVFSKIKERFGGRLRFFISGSAALSREVAQFFHSTGVLILEGYGLTETSAASFVNLPGAFRLGSVGRPLPGTEVRIAESDGEVLIRSRGVMRGYHELPEATAEALEPDGWMHTGDIGRVDPEGFLWITDRKKDLIKTSGGKYIAPQALEGKLKAICPYVNQVLVHGDRRNFVTALITLDGEAMRTWANEHGLANLSLAQLAVQREVHALIERYVAQLNATLASFETIKRFAIVGQEFSEASGELTASLKLKRKVIEARFHAELDALYESSGAELNRRAPERPIAP